MVPTRAPKSESAPPVAALAAQIVQAALRPDVTVSDLIALAEGDPAFTVRLLSIVNSAAYNRGTRVSSLRHAASLLGIRGMRNVALSLSLSDMAPMGEDGAALLGISLRRGAVARLLAETLRLPNAEEFFTAGLLLELGILSRARADRPGAVEVARTPAPARIVKERAAGVAPHPASGAELAASWRLTEDVVEAIAHHHDPQPPEAQTARVAWVTERVAAVFEGGDFAANHKEAMAAMAMLGLQGEAAEQVLRTVHGHVEQAGEAFQRPLGPQPNIDSLLLDVNASLLELNRNYAEAIRTLELLVAENERLTKNLRDANERLERQASTDELTGLNNRRAFVEALRRDLARADRSRTKVTLVLMDVDHFKKVNDTYGHQMGDEVLRRVAEVIRASVREGDVPGRYGGEEFAVLLPATDAQQAKVVAERIRTSLEKVEFTSPQGPFRVTSSFGLATISWPGCTPGLEKLISRADEALYQAKREGRNRVILAPG